MTRRTFGSATLAAVLAISVLPGAAAAQDSADPVDENKPDKSVTGTITEVDGAWYITPDGGEPIALSFGPAWFNDLYELFGLSNDDGDVTIGGNLRDGMPNEHASDVAKEAAAKAPKIKVLAVNEQKREKGKPAWAGGPKDDMPPGQAKKAADDMPPGQAKKAGAQVSSGKPDKPGKGPKSPLEDD